MKFGEAGNGHAKKQGFYPKPIVHFKRGGWGDVIRLGLLKVPSGSCGSKVAPTPRGYTPVCGKEIGWWPGFQCWKCRWRKTTRFSIFRREAPSEFGNWLWQLEKWKRERWCSRFLARGRGGWWGIPPDGEDGSSG